MQRIIKFRGKRVDNGEWVYGYGVVLDWEFDMANIIHSQGVNRMQCTAVDPATVGQFTGLTDKNGKEIYEGDILSHHKKASLYKDCPIKIIGAVVYTNGKFETETIKVINENFFDNSSIHFGIEPIDWIHLPNFKQSEAIGNIYENPELCKG